MSQHNLNNAEKVVKHQTIVIIIVSSTGIKRVDYNMIGLELVNW